MLIELTGLVVNKSLSNLGIDAEEEEKEVRMTFNTNHIESFRELIDDEGEIVSNETILYTTGNGSFVIRQSYNEIKQLLNDNKVI